MPELNISNVINVTISLSQAPVQVPNVNTLALFVSDPIPSGWTANQEYAKYSDLASVADDFGTSSQAYNDAVMIFQQIPNLLTTDGYLVIVPLGKASLALSTITYAAKHGGDLPGNGITIAYTAGGTAGSEVVTVIGSAISVQIQTTVSTAAQVRTALIASAAASALITHALNGSGSTAQVTTGATNLTGGETVQAGIIRVTPKVYFFACMMGYSYDGAASAFADLADYVQTADKVFFYEGNVSTLLTDTTSIFYDVAVAAQSHMRCLYYSSDIYPTITYSSGASAGSEVVTVSGNAITVQIASGTSTITQILAALAASADASALVTAALATGASGATTQTSTGVSAVPVMGGLPCTIKGITFTPASGVGYAQTFAAAYAGRALSCDFTGSNTLGTMHLKQLVGMVPDPAATQTILGLAQDAGVDIYVQIANTDGECFISGENQFFDQVYGSLALKFQLQANGYNYLAGATTKIPQTEDGMNGLKGAYRRALVQFVGNGYLAPGAWDSSTFFGNQADLIRCVATVGYYVYSAPMADQSAANRQTRVAPLCQIAGKEAGAIQKSNVQVTVNP